MNQPAQKSYRDWNAGWPEASWQISEPQMAYQGAYVNLLAELAAGEPSALGLDVPAFSSPGQATLSTGGMEPGGLGAILWSVARGTFAAATPAWCVDLGIEMGQDPLLQVVTLGYASPAGALACSHSIPAGLAGITVYFQASEAFTCPDPRQSAVVRVTIQ
jgi:hypothetical protein